MIAAKKLDVSSTCEPLEVIEYDGVRYAEILRRDATVPITRFFSPASSSFQFGLLAHEAGFCEPAHTHKPVARTVSDLQQMFVVQRGKVEVRFYNPSGKVIALVTLLAGDAIVLIHGGHSVHALEDMQCVSVKQGPFLGDANDKVLLQEKK